MGTVRVGKKIGRQIDEPISFTPISHHPPTIPGGLQTLHTVEGEPGENGVGKLMLEGGEQ